MRFSGDPQFPSRGLGMGIFNFGLDRKIPGDGDRGFRFSKNLNHWDGDLGFLRLKC